MMRLGRKLSRLRHPHGFVFVGAHADAKNTADAFGLRVQGFTRGGSEIFRFQDKSPETMRQDFEFLPEIWPEGFVVVMRSPRNFDFHWRSLGDLSKFHQKQTGANQERENK